MRCKTNANAHAGAHGDITKTIQNEVPRCYVDVLRDGAQ